MFESARALANAEAALGGAAVLALRRGVAALAERHPPMAFVDDGHLVDGAARLLARGKIVLVHLDIK